MRRALPHLVVLALALVSSAGCKDEPKDTQKTATPKTPEKIPEDFVVNDFFREGRTARPVIADAAVAEGGLLAGGPEGDGGASQLADDDAVPERKFKVLEAGTDPKARRYAFAAKTETRNMTLKASVTQEAAGQQQQQDQPPLALTLAFTPKKDKGRSRLEAILKKIDVTAPPGSDPRQKAQAAAALSALTGVGVSMDVTPRGGLSDLKFEGKEPPRGLEEMLQLITQAFDVVLAPWPEDPVGVGGKWVEETAGKEQGVQTKNTSTFTLKEMTGDAYVVDATISRKAPKQALRGDPRLPQGATVELDAKGQYAYEGKLGAVASKVSGELSTTIKIEVPTPKGKVEQLQIMKVKHLIETPRP
jgi:hypothetical protein